MTWIKGQSGNPKGRKRGRVSMAEELRVLLNTRDPNGMIYGEAILRALATAASNANIEAIKVVFDRMDGRVKELATDPGQDSRVTVNINGMPVNATDSQPRRPPEAE